MKSNLFYSDIQNVIEYIEKNIKTTITLDEISSHVSISKYHLSRVFHAISSTALMSYVKERKLSSSTIELLNTNLKISDISQEYGFNYEQSYIRSFKNAFGLSPNRYRKEKPILRIRDRINLNYIRAIGKDGIAVYPLIVIIPEFYIAGIRHKIYTQEDMLFHVANAKGNDFYNNYWNKIKNVLSANIYIGLVENIIEHESYNYYMPSFQVSVPDQVPEGMICRKVPTNKYAVFKYIGLHHARLTNINNLIDTLFYIYGEWFPKSGYTQSAPYHFERINEKISRNEYCEVEICVPVSNNIF